VLSALNKRRYLVLSTFVFVLMVVQTLNQQWSQDFWAHSAAVRELATHPLDPLHPQLDLDAPHPFFTAYALGASALSTVLGIDSITALAVLGLANLLLVLIGLRVFTKATIKDPRAGFYVLVFTLVLWGIRPWRYSGFLHLNALGFELPLPSTFATGLTLLALAAFASFLRSGSAVRLGTVAGLAALVLISHPITAIFLGIGILALSLSASSQHRSRAMLGVVAIGAVSALAAVLWPYYSFVELVFGEAAEFHLSNRTMYEDALLRIWPALLGVPLLVARLRTNRRDPLVWTFAGLVLVYLYGGLADAWSYGRVMPALVLMLHMALAGWLSDLEARSQIPVVGYLGLGGLLAISSIGMLPGLVRAVPEQLLPASIRADPRLETTAEHYQFLAREVGQYDTVLADMATAWPVPTYGGKVVANAAPQLFVDDNRQRQIDVVGFFSASATRQQRLATIKRYEVEYVLVDSTSISPRTLDDLEGLGSVTAVEGDLVLIELPEGP
jgi:hypothetical protein